MKMGLKTVLCAVAIAAAFPCQGASPTTSGAATPFLGSYKYAEKGGGGEMVVSQGGTPGTVKASISTVNNARGDMCDVELQGRVDNGRVQLVDEGKSCRADATFDASGKASLSIPQNFLSGCRMYCGISAGFDGKYRKATK